MYVMVSPSTAGKKVTDEEIWDILETDNLQVFTQNVRLGEREGGKEGGRKEGKEGD